MHFEKHITSVHSNPILILTITCAFLLLLYTIFNTIISLLSDIIVVVIVYD